MDSYHRRAPAHNRFVIPLGRPRIEPALDCDGFYVIRQDHGWLCGDRRQALREFAGLVDIERWGSTT